MVKFNKQVPNVFGSLLSTVDRGANIMLISSSISYVDPLSPVPSRIKPSYLKQFWDHEELNVTWRLSNNNKFKIELISKETVVRSYRIVDTGL